MLDFVGEKVHVLGQDGCSHQEAGTYKVESRLIHIKLVSLP